MKKLSVLFLLLTSLIFTGCFDNKDNETKKVIKVGTSGGYFPFTFLKNDVLQGFEIDVWNAIGKKLNAEVEFKTSKFAGLFGMLETGKIDTISNEITMTEKRVAKYDFATPYVYDGTQIVVNKANDTIKTVEDLKGKKVGVTLGTNYEEILRNRFKDGEVDIITYDGGGFAQDVILGRIDAFVQDRISSVELIKKAKLPLKLAGKPFETLKNSFPFLRNEKNKELIKEVNKAIKELREDGTLTKISMKWFDTDITSK